MARRTVTATFAGGMISDEPKPGTARYLENFVPRVDGVVPVGNVYLWNRAVTGISTVNGITSGAVAHGWSAGGTVHPKFGFVGLLDLHHTTATPISTADWASKVSNYGMESTPLDTSAHRALMNIADIESASGCGTMKSADHNSFIPICCNDVISSATGTASYTSAIRPQALNGLQRWINTEDEVLMCGMYATSDRVYRYAGATGDIGLQGSNSSTTAVGSATGYANPTASHVWTNVINIYGDAAIAASATGMYIGMIMGHGLDEFTASTAKHAVKEFLVTGVSGTSAARTLYLDRRIYFESANQYCRCVVGNSSQLSPSQVSRGTETQPFGTLYTSSTTAGFRNGSYNPVGRHGAAYHQGRLFLMNNSKLSWSGTVDETLQMTATAYFNTATASTSVTTAKDWTYGVEYKHISLWSVSGCLNVFPHIGGNGVGLVSMDDGLIILKRGGIFRLVGGVSYDGASNSVDLQVVSNTIGPDSQYSWAETPAGIIFTQGERIWLFDGNQLQDISSGSIQESFRENIASHRQSQNTLRQQSIVTRVCSDGDRVFFTPMRYTLATATGSEAVPDVFFHDGQSIHNRHLVLSLRDQKWYYIYNKNLSVPAAILNVKSNRGSTYSRYWLNSTRRESTYIALPNSYNRIEIADIHGMLREANDPNVGVGTFNGWDAYGILPEKAKLVTHPFVDGMDAFRPLSALLKHTLYTGGSWSATASSTSEANLPSFTVLDSAPTFTPIDWYYTGDSPPEWWAAMTQSATSLINAAKPDSVAWSPREHWSADGSTSTARAISQVDRFPLTHIEGAMFSPGVMFQDTYVRQDGDIQHLLNYEILHGIALELEDVENRTDR